MKRLAFALLCAALALTLTSGQAVTGAGDQKPGKEPDPAALKRARKTVKMLDDIYKSAIVVITEKYVKKENDYPAGRVFVNLFKDISAKGWHDVQLLDVSGKPADAQNVADDAFEKEGVKQMKAGKQYYEEVASKGGKQYLRAMTFVPVVLEKCTLCHPNYKDFKKGEAIGAISYQVELE